MKKIWHPYGMPEQLQKINYIDYVFIDRKTIKIKILCKPEKNLNKSLEIRQKIRKQQVVRRHTVDESQKDLIRIVEVNYPIYKKENGEDKFDKISKGIGVQVENKVYLLDDFIYVNKKHVKIKPINDVTNVSPEISKLFKEKRAKFNKR